MDRRKQNWIIFFVIAALVAGHFVVRFIRNSDIYLECKTERIMEEIREFITEDATEWQVIAKAIREEAQSREDKTLYRDTYQSEFPETLDAQVSSMIANCPVNFDTVYVEGMTQLEYPEGCCVFRYTIEFDRGIRKFGKGKYASYAWADHGVYAWVDLVYTPDCDTQKYRRFAEESAHIIDDWYVIKFYGY